MKKHFSILSLFLLSSFLFLSCRQDNEVTESLDTENYKNANLSARTTSDSLVLTSDTFNIVGETHNNALDYIYNNQILGKISSNYDEINNTSIHYMFNVDENMKLTSDDPQSLKTQEQKAKAKFIIDNSVVLSMSEIVAKYNKISENQKKYIDLLDTAVKSNSLTYDVIISNIEDIERNAIEELSDSEIVYFLGVSSVAKSSVKYWNTNSGEKWFTSYNIPFQPIGTISENTQGRVNWRNVAIVDLVAFAAGFPSGVTVGMVAGGLAAGVGSGGILAGVGAVLGGLEGGSASGLAAAATASAIRIGAEQIVSFWD